MANENERRTGPGGSQHREIILIKKTIDRKGKHHVCYCRTSKDKLQSAGFVWSGWPRKLGLAGVSGSMAPVDAWPGEPWLLLPVSWFLIARQLQEHGVGIWRAERGNVLYRMCLKAEQWCQYASKKCFNVRVAKRRSILRIIYVFFFS